MKYKNKKNSFLTIIILLILFLIGLIIGYNFNKNDNEQEKKIVNENYKEEESIVKEENLMDGITLNYHASIRLEKNNKIFYFDPYKIDDVINDADYIFITHSHYDHYSESDIKKVMNNNTKFVVTSDLESKIINLGVLKENIVVTYPSESYTLDDFSFDVIPSYNTNKSFHRKSYNWVGYNLNLSGTNYYIVGDSDITDELKNVKCDVIFIPVGGTYTMTDKEAAEVVNIIKPKYAVPIHYGVVGSITNAENFVNLLNEGINGVILKK